MSPRARTLLWLFAWATLAVSIALGLFLAWVYTEGLPPGTAITIDGQRWVVPALTEPGHWGALVLGVVLLAMVVVLVLPLIAVAAIVVPVVASSLGLLTGLALAVLVTWALLLLVRRLWRSRSGAATIPGP